METQKVLVGSITSTSSGATQDDTRLVEFEAVNLAEHRQFGTGRAGCLTETRGTTERLFRLGDGQLAVHVENWSHWQGEVTTHSLHEVTEVDLGPNGDFWQLGTEGGFCRSLKFDEAVTSRGS